MLMRGFVAAREAGVGPAYLEMGLRGMWEDGLKLDDRDVLAEAIDAAGLDSGEPDRGRAQRAGQADARRHDRGRGRARRVRRSRPFSSARRCSSARSGSARSRRRSRRMKARLERTPRLALSSAAMVRVDPRCNVGLSIKSAVVDRQFKQIGRFRRRAGARRHLANPILRLCDELRGRRSARRSRAVGVADRASPAPGPAASSILVRSARADAHR